VESKLVDIEKDQIFIIDKIKKYQETNCKSEFPFNAEFFCTYSNSFGFALLKYWIKKISFFRLMLFFFKEFYACLNLDNYILIESHIHSTNFKKIILTWGNENSLKDNFFFDKYLNIPSSNYKETLWIVLYDGDSTKIQKLDNVIYILNKKISYFQKLSNFCKWLLKSIYRKEFKSKNLLYFFSWHNFHSYKILEVVRPLFSQNLKELFIAYEAQPFQTRIIQYIKKNFTKTKCVGYINTFPSFAPNFIKKNFSPDQIIVNSINQFEALTKYLGWSKNDIRLIESVRFRVKEKHDMSNKIYLPINFSSSNKILIHFKEIFDYLKNYDLSSFQISNHPTTVKSIKHLKLIENIKLFLKNQQGGNEKIINTSICVGFTSSVIEALFYRVNVFHIMEEPIFEAYNNNFWKDINIKNENKNIAEYTINKPDFVLFGNDNSLVKEYF
jgi:hypothetical protein